jgi:hypothetical protein
MGHCFGWWKRKDLMLKIEGETKNKKDNWKPATENVPAISSSGWFL